MSSLCRRNHRCELFRASDVNLVLCKPEQRVVFESVEIASRQASQKFDIAGEAGRGFQL
jgi:hypothetical protein